MKLVITILTDLDCSEISNLLRILSSSIAEDSDHSEYMDGSIDITHNGEVIGNALFEVEE